ALYLRYQIVYILLMKLKLLPQGRRFHFNTFEKGRNLFQATKKCRILRIASMCYITTPFIRSKKAMRKTSLQIVNEFLIKEAMAVLADTATTIAYVADNLGFAESHSFYHFSNELLAIPNVIPQSVVGKTLNPVCIIYLL